MANPSKKTTLPNGMSEEDFKNFKEFLEIMKKLYEPLKDKETRDEALTGLARRITGAYDYWLPEAFHISDQGEVEGEVARLLEGLVEFLLGEEE